MRSTAPRRLGSLRDLRREPGSILAVVGVLFLLAFLYTSLQRVVYPYDLEWMEGGALEHVRRVLSGEPIYVAPSVEFVPFIYAPGYWFVSAGVAKLVGLGLPALRWVSFGAICGVFVLLGWFIGRETRNRIAGLLAVGLLAASYGQVHGWYDLARVDSLALLLLLSAIACMRFTTTWWGTIATALLLFAGFLIKQSSVIALLPLLLYQAWRRRLQGVATLVLFAAMALGSIGIGNALTADWYQFYLFTLPSQHPWVEATADFWLREILRPWGPALLAGVLFFALAPRRRSPPEPGPASRDWGETALWYGILGVGMVGSSWLARLHLGGAINNDIPAFGWIAMVAALAFAWCRERIASSPRRIALQLVVVAAGLLQFGLLLYDPSKFIPTSADRDAGMQLCRLIEGFPGDVYVPRHPGFALAVGKRAFAHDMAIADVMRGKDQEKKDRLERSISEALARQHFDAVIIDGIKGADFYLQPHVPQYTPAYRISGVENKVLNMRTGVRTSPAVVYVRRNTSGPSR